LEYSDRCVAYITRGDQLLVFEHVKYPEMGVQVPAGHPERGESLESAVLREAEEETGLKGLRLEQYLGFKIMDFTQKGYGAEKRHFFHLVFDGETPGTWVHTEKHPSMGPDLMLDFRLYWVPIDKADLFWGHGAMLDKI
jgi:8-oxo-dGTP pyrophosphatase MutT (NUDIX family)